MKYRDRRERKKTKTQRPYARKRVRRTTRTEKEERRRSQARGGMRSYGVQCGGGRTDCGGRYGMRFLRAGDRATAAVTVVSAAAAAGGRWPNFSHPVSGRRPSLQCGHRTRRILPCAFSRRYPGRFPSRHEPSDATATV